MTQEQPLVISISRQLGSGGAYLGQQLAKKLHITYVDREIINKAAQELQVPEQDIESRDETKTPLWRSILSSSSYMNPAIYSPPPLGEPSDRELYQTESEIIERISKSFSAVIVGRGGSYVLRDHPRHLSIFLHGTTQFRTQRIRKLYNLNEEKAKKLIETSDKARGVYLRAMTGQDWIDSRQYNFCIDTSVTGLDNTVEIILNVVRVRFGEVSPNNV
jgi:CMP/dCMP kinase